jgi:hypothetical protein
VIDGELFARGVAEGAAGALQSLSPLSGLRETPEAGPGAVPLVFDGQPDTERTRSTQAPRVGDAIWSLDAIRLPSGDTLADGWIVIYALTL